MVGIENPVHLIFIAAIALIFLGPKRLPELAKALGHGIREFRDAISDASGPQQHVAPEQPPPSATAGATPGAATASVEHGPAETLDGHQPGQG